MDKQFCKQEEKIERNLIENIVGKHGYNIVTDYTDHRYFKYTIQRNRK